jgi:hypothetical protein
MSLEGCADLPNRVRGGGEALGDVSQARFSGGFAYRSRHDHYPTWRALQHAKHGVGSGPPGRHGELGARSSDNDDLGAIRGRLCDDRRTEVSSAHEPRHDLHPVRVAAGTGLLEQATSRVLDVVKPSVQREQRRHLDDEYGGDSGVVVDG